MIPERTIDAWLAIAVAQAFPSAAVWLPTPQAQSRAQPWDLLAEVDPAARMIMFENKALFDSAGNVGIDLGGRASREQLARLPTLAGLPIYYGLPGPCSLAATASVPVSWDDPTRQAEPHRSIDMGRAAMRLHPEPFASWLYLVPPGVVAASVRPPFWLPCDSFRACFSIGPLIGAEPSSVAASAVPTLRSLLEAEASVAIRRVQGRSLTAVVGEVEGAIQQLTLADVATMTIVVLDP